MSYNQVRDGAGDEDPPENTLLTPEQRAAQREVRELLKRSGELIRESQRITRPKEFLHHFPPLPAPRSPARTSGARGAACPPA